MTSAAAPAFPFEFNSALDGRWKVGSTAESGALSRALSISEGVCAGGRAGGGEGKEAA